MKLLEISSRILFNDFFKIREGIIQVEDKKDSKRNPKRRLCCEHGDAAGVLVWLHNTDEFVFVNQFRYPVFCHASPGTLDEIVAGIIENESPEDCARRETREESGYELEKLVFLSKFFPSPGVSSEIIHLFLGITNSEKFNSRYISEDDANEIKIIHYNILQARKMLNEAKFQDAKTIIALQRFFLNYEEYRIGL